MTPEEWQRHRSLKADQPAVRQRYSMKTSMGKLKICHSYKLTDIHVFNREVDGGESGVVLALNDIHDMRKEIKMSI